MLNKTESSLEERRPVSIRIVAASKKSCADRTGSSTYNTVDHKIARNFELPAITPTI